MFNKYHSINSFPICLLLLKDLDYTFQIRFAEQDRTGGEQGISVIKSGLSCNHYRIFLVKGKNGNDCRITLLPSQEFPARPLFYPV